MKKLLLLITVLSVYVSANAQGVICIQHGNAATFYSRLDTAITHAQNGDILYLPGGLLAASASININKKLTIIGAGYHPDSAKATSPSILLFNIYFNPGSDSSVLTGLDCRGEVDFYTSNITVTRCNISNSCNWTSSYAISNIRLLENIFGGAVNASQSFPTSCLISNNIFFSYISNFQACTFKNNIFIHVSQPYQSTSSCLFENNIFLINANLSGGSNLFNNNLFVEVSSGLSGSGNIYNQSLSTIFMNYTASTAWDKSQNFHLKIGCPGISAGSDGTDIGIYGGTLSPFKDGGIPYNPHYQSISIGGTTNSSGKLPVNITVKAQNR